jgi:hypothetical protein
MPSMAKNKPETAQPAMDAALEAAPGAHDNATDDTTDGSGGLHCPENEAIAVSTSQDHRSQHGEANPGKQVADEKDQLQAEQAGAGEDVLEAVGGFFPDIASTFLTLLSARRLWHEDDQQRTDGKHECHHVNDHDASNFDEGKQRTGKQGRQHARPGIHQ